VPQRPEPLILHWIWPGTGVSPTRERWFTFLFNAAAFERAAVSVREEEERRGWSSGGRTSRLIERYLTDVDARNRASFLAEGLHAGSTWAPSGDDRFDAAARVWVAAGRAALERAARVAPFEPVTEVDVIPQVRDRRPRHDRPEIQTRPPQPKKQIVRRVLTEAEIDERLTAANAEVDAILARVSAAIARPVGRSHPEDR